MTRSVTLSLTLSLCALIGCGEPEITTDTEPSTTTEPTSTECVATAEVCDGVDNDCDGEIDEDPQDGSTFFADGDGDGFGDDLATTIACEVPQGFVDVGGDCDDAAANRNPGEQEVCDDVDNDCDGVIDLDPVDGTPFFADGDGDGFGDDLVTTVACEAPQGFVDVGGDCDDAAANRNPGEQEVCDDIDNDCDGAIDLDPIDGTPFFADVDGDGFGDDLTQVVACEAPQDSVIVGGDCDDAAVDVSPAGLEVCDDIDNDCDGTIDLDPADGSIFFADADGDGFGDALVTTIACEVPQGFAANATDCDDTTAQINPGVVDDCDDEGVDNDCDPTTGNVSLFDGTSVVDLTHDFEGTAQSPAVIVLNTPGTLAVCEGTYFARLEVQADVEIVGVAGSELTVIDGGSAGTVVTYPTRDVTVGLTGLTIQNGLGDPGATCQAGGICLSGGAVTLAGEDLVLRDNVSPNEGGALAMLGGVVDLLDAQLLDNEAARGGAVHVRPNGRLSLTDSVLSGNLADAGGAIFMLGGASATTLDNVDVSSNHATSRGGGLLIDNGTLTVRSSLIEANTAGSEGGGIAYVGVADPSTIEDSVIERNRAPDGAALSVGRTVTVRNTGIFGNIASNGSNGAVEVVGSGSFTAEVCDFDDPVTGTNNSPADVVAGGDTLELGLAVDIVCDSSGCDQ